MHLVIQYTLALANLYGIYDRTLLIDIYNRQNSENVTLEELSDLEPHEMEILKEVLKSDFVLVEEILFLKQLLIMIGCAQISFLEGNYYYAIADGD